MLKVRIGVFKRWNDCIREDGEHLQRRRGTNEHNLIRFHQGIPSRLQRTLHKGTQAGFVTTGNRNRPDIDNLIALVGITTIELGQLNRKATRF